MKDVKDSFKSFIHDFCSGEDFHLLSLIGSQPSELAVKLETLRDSGFVPIKTTIFPTASTLQESRRLIEWGGNHYAIQSETISTDARKFRDFLKQWLDQNVPKGVKVVFAADGGFASHVAIFSHLLLPYAPLFLHSDMNFLYAVDTKGISSRHRPLEDLGLDQLLSLYALSNSAEVVDPPHLSQDLETANRPFGHPGLTFKGCLPFSLAYERCGCLHALIDLTNIHNNNNRLLFIREAAEIWRKLNGLHPYLVAWGGVTLTSSYGEQARSNKIEPISRNGLERWLNWTPPSPRLYPSEQAYENLDTRSMEAIQGRALVLAVGTYPYATLASLATHRPEHAYLIVDEDNAEVQQMRDKFAKVQRALGLRRLEFIDSDPLCVNLRSWVKRKKVVDPLTVDVTPGTKMQTRALASLSLAELWSLDREGGAIELLGDGRRDSEGVPVKVLAFFTGAAGNSGRKLSTNHRKFFLLLADFFQNADFPFNINNTLKTDNSSLTANTAATTVTVGKKTENHNSLRCNNGEVFEMVVAHLLSQCKPFGKLPDEVVLNLKWHRPSRAPRAELDVAVRWGTHILAVSCKSGKNFTSTSRSEIEAVAEHGFGRLAIPLLVVFKFNDPQITDAIKESMKEESRAPILQMGDLVDSKKRDDTIHKILTTRVHGRPVSKTSQGQNTNTSPATPVLARSASTNAALTATLAEPPTEQKHNKPSVALEIATPVTAGEDSALAAALRKARIFVKEGHLDLAEWIRQNFFKLDGTPKSRATLRSIQEKAAKEFVKRGRSKAFVKILTRLYLASGVLELEPSGRTTLSDSPVRRFSLPEETTIKIAAYAASRLDVGGLPVESLARVLFGSDDEKFVSAVRAGIARTQDNKLPASTLEPNEPSLTNAELADQDDEDDWCAFVADALKPVGQKPKQKRYS